MKIQERIAHRWLGDAPIIVHGYAVGGSLETASFIHLNPNCDTIPTVRRPLNDLGTVTVPGTKICNNCLKYKVEQAQSPQTR